MAGSKGSSMRHCFSAMLGRTTLRIGPGLYFQEKPCKPHYCRCGWRMDSRNLHGLSCKYSAGRFPSHSAMNDVIKRELHKAGLLSVLEEFGLELNVC